MHLAYSNCRISFFPVLQQLLWNLWAPTWALVNVVEADRSLFRRRVLLARSG
jgi:hypothetical protein